VDKYLERENLPEPPLSSVPKSSGLYSDCDRDLTAKQAAKKICYVSYLHFGFIRTRPEDEPKPLRVLVQRCWLADAGMKPSKLMQQQRTRHDETVTKPV
jgi:hypothetical protein